MNVTDEMAAAAAKAFFRSGLVDVQDIADMKRGLAAALAAAPTVDGWVWCVMHDQPHRPQDDWIIRCTGHTHRSLLLGPEVES